MRDIGSRLELFVDDWLIDQTRGEAQLRMHEPVAKSDGLAESETWEGDHPGYATLIDDGDRFRFYYQLFHDPERPDGEDDSHLESGLRMLAAYAESKDGVEWHKPRLGLYEHKGSVENNIIFSGFGERGKGIHGFALYKDANPDAPEESRYKALGAERRAVAGGSLYAMHSADGLRWSLMQEDPVMTFGSFDSQNQAFWDSRRGEYSCYFRDFATDIDTVFEPGHRIIKSATSADFLHWENPTSLTYADSPAEQLYTNQVQPYYRAPHILIGFPTRYVERAWSDLVETFPEADERRRRAFEPGGHERFGASMTDALLMTSRDGTHFNRWNEAYVRPGIQSRGRWIYGDNYKCLGMIETPSELSGAPAEISFYVGEGGERKGASWRYRRYTTRVDGFVSLNATHRGGEVVTHPLRFAGIRLVINFATSAAGWIRTEVQAADGLPLEGFGLDDCLESVGDELERVVRWKGGASVASLQDRPVRLRFVMREADLYSLRFAKE